MMWWLWQAQVPAKESVFLKSKLKRSWKPCAYFINLFCLSVSYSIAPMISITEAGRDTAENGRELHSDSKVCVDHIFIMCEYKCLWKEREKHSINFRKQVIYFLCCCHHNIAWFSHRNCWKVFVWQRERHCCVRVWWKNVCHFLAHSGVYTVMSMAEFCSHVSLLCDWRLMFNSLYHYNNMHFSLGGLFIYMWQTHAEPCSKTICCIYLKLYTCEDKCNGW